MNEYKLAKGEFVVTADVKKSFDQEGYIIIRGLLDENELGKVTKAVEEDPARMKYSFGRDDGAGRQAKYLVWNHPNDDITGMVARCEKVAGTFEKLLGGEVYHYHTKLMQKDAHVGGQFNWHQDYGYWYHNGLLSPDMGTVFIALDKADKTNGCLQIIPKSHQLGRVEHIKVGGEVAADPTRVEQISKRFPVVYAEMGAGDALFFHSNVLHRSDQNKSDRRRWGFLIGYNRADNDPVTKHHHPSYTKLNKVNNNSIRESSTETDETGKDFMINGRSKELNEMGEAEK